MASSKTAPKKAAKPATRKPAAKKNDPVNHPSHYTDGKIEVIDFIEDKKLGFHLGNSVKYIARAGKKDPSKEIEDLEKQDKDLKIERDSIDSQLNKIDKEEKKYIQNKSEFEKLSIQKKNLEDNMLSIATSMQELEDKLFTADIDSLKSDFESKKKNYQELISHHLPKIY